MSLSFSTPFTTYYFLLLAVRLQLILYSPWTSFSFSVSDPHVTHVSSLPHYPRLPPGVIKPPTSNVALLTAGFGIPPPPIFFFGGGWGSEILVSCQQIHTTVRGPFFRFPHTVLCFANVCIRATRCKQHPPNMHPWVVSISSPGICYDFLQSLSGHTVLTIKPRKSFLCVQLSSRFNKVSEFPITLHLRGGKRCELKRHQKEHIYSGFT